MFAAPGKVCFSEWNGERKMRKCLILWVMFVACAFDGIFGGDDAKVSTGAGQGVAGQKSDASAAITASADYKKIFLQVLMGI